MAGALKTYSPDQVKILFGAAIISGYAPGTFISIEEVGDGTASESGADGETARAMSLDRRVNLNITLQQTSRSNDILSALYLADRTSGGNGAVPMTVTDLRGTTLWAGTAWIVKMAPATFSNGLETKEWPIQGVGLFTNGGNN